MCGRPGLADGVADGVADDVVDTDNLAVKGINRLKLGFVRW